MVWTDIVYKGIKYRRERGLCCLDCQPTDLGAPYYGMRFDGVLIGEIELKEMINKAIETRENTYQNASQSKFAGGEKMRVTVGRFDQSKVIEVSEGKNVREALVQGGYTKSENEVIQDLDGNEYEGSEEAENAQGYFLVARVKSGNQ